MNTLSLVLKCLSPVSAGVILKLRHLRIYVSLSKSVLDFFKGRHSLACSSGSHLSESSPYNCMTLMLTHHLALLISLHAPSYFYTAEKFLSVLKSDLTPPGCDGAHD